MKYNVTDIEFDFDDGNDGESYPLTFEEEIAIRDSALGVWEADNEDDMIDEDEDTLTILSKYVNSLNIDNKEELDKLLISLYNESLTLETL